MSIPNRFFHVSFATMVASAILINGILATAGAEVTYIPKPLYFDPWEAESLFAGAGLLGRIPILWPLFVND